ncbi:hypothetical protein MYAM1_001278 [Malassezia yamatoensis]|uniref:Uncharacterized protein n=1 Tax=Malassezia yamatoensis TaxID=253288 RepID=A0AAJ5YR22_9BASI|nr:hypothetical protein MYAM1_001278 [Malassezia yamatoensis]
MVRVIVEELPELPERDVDLLGPSDITETESLSSLLYMLDHPPTQDASIIAEIDRMMDYEVFTDAMGRRLLAILGHDVEETRLQLAQYLLDHTSDHNTDDSMVFTRSTRFPGRAHTSLGSWLQELALGVEEPNATYTLLPGGYISAATYSNQRGEDPVDDDIDSDKESDTLDDEEYLDWLGSQLLQCHSGLTPYIIDGVQESSDNFTPLYTLEISTFVSPSQDELTLDDDDLNQLAGTSPNERPRKTLRLESLI